MCEDLPFTKIDGIEVSALSDSIHHKTLIRGILNRKLKVGLSTSNWTEMTFVA